MAKKSSTSDPDLRTRLRLPSGPVDWDALDTRATPGYPGKGKKDAGKHTAALAGELADLQERLYAAGRADPEGAPKVLVLLQGMDTSGKGGVIRHAIGLVDPQGVQLTAFKKPTEEELTHDFLWRIRKALPDPGMMGIFDRSQYEDVLTVRVNQLVEEKVWKARYDTINAFEAELAEQGTTIIKCFLHVSYEEQGERLAERLDNPEKHWKYNPGDVDERLLWADYREAYADALRTCDADHAPWYVIPSDRKWYRNWAVAQLLLEHLRALQLGWPAADFDPEVERQRLAET
ncbi:MAG TPA: polyphosphate kinase 2 family protein [Candidatus Avipropionibacterium avicola]|uniref:Polyphosphate kinase 2 family protein n=1 Tax=Candidatus Avipropionibacterium avicola TaxID=2840701 RepID=A0A9D1GZX8_9ACTN|nr:polyphosphate kinase 2 family protein [Candidatus Avipropionibacterium avicola]